MPTIGDASAGSKAARSSPACRCGRRPPHEGAAPSRCPPNPLDSFEQHQEFMHADLRGLGLIELLVQLFRALAALGRCGDPWWQERLLRVAQALGRWASEEGEE